MRKVFIITLVMIVLTVMYQLSVMLKERAEVSKDAPAAVEKPMTANAVSADSIKDNKEAQSVEEPIDPNKIIVY